MPTRDIIEILNQIIALPQVQNTNVNLSPSGYINLSEVNADVFGSPTTAVLTSQNINSLQTVSGEILTVQVGANTNIGSLRSNNMAVSGTWRCTMVISDSDYSHTETHVWGESQTLAQATVAIKALAAQRAKLLGSNLASGNQVKSRGNPSIEYLRIADALNPKNVQLIDYSDNGYFGPAGGGGAGGDFFGLAISHQLSGQNVNDPTVFVQPSLGLVGQPDSIAKDSVYRGNTGVWNGTVTWDAALVTYLTYLASGTQKWGCMGQSIAQGKKVATTCSLDTDNLFKFTCTAHGYNSGDKVRITGANNSKFNGSYKVIVVDANTLKLAAMLPVGWLPFTLAKVQRTQFANGVRALDFYKYQSVYVAPKIRSRKPGRAFSPISFRHRKRK